MVNQTINSCIPYYNIDAHSRLLMPHFISAGSHRPNPLNVKFLAWQQDLGFCRWNRNTVYPIIPPSGPIGHVGPIGPIGSQKLLGLAR